ncbi:hypothetical protein TTHERM_00078950 (macronuclear) [Tetrahymena thermophila SB210]|uniref:Uncharacterized protein n=1 Tax=Tetrahymena thermophila (strain SB210) TaxID=312017 RepID=Q23FW9_TETTS|nr:hypothetical protein TTHERM_00078950 [Tetrahymena thermophila SB210]EAR95491.2 hypothetical protein TTHERM_00078950 [Tetrahymena thermophila SB210]|eukprot:XP_001015736.2 hypothetical protein TTHERM_00078950 [Tetrahymena thermophila SB210]
MFMKSIMKGKMPKTQEEMIQDERQYQESKKQKFQITDDLIRAVNRNVAPILVDLKLKQKDGDDQDLDLNFNKEDLIDMVKNVNQYEDVKLVQQKSKIDYDQIQQQQKKKKPQEMTDQEIMKQLQEIANTRLRAANSNYLNLFGVERSRCTMPQCQKICPQYRGSYNIKPYQGVELFSCINCKCPMNSHEIPLKQDSFSNTLSEELSSKYIESTHLNFKSLVALFLVWPQEEDKYIMNSNRIPDFIKQRKKHQQNQTIYSANLEKLVQIFNEGSFDILSYYDCSPTQLYDKLVEKKIFSIKKPVPKQEIDSYLAFIKSFQKADHSSKSHKSTENKRNLLNNERDLQKFQLYQRYKDKIQAKFDKMSHSQQKDIEQAKVYVLLISSKYQNPYTQFRKFLVASKQSIPNEFVYYYSSKYKYKGIIDCQQFFPDFFKINYQTFVLAQHIPKKVLLQSRADATISDEKMKIKEEEIRNREVKKNDDKLRDYLDFNNFVVIEEDFSKQQSKLGQAFEFIDDEEDSRAQFFKFCQVGAKSLNIKICAKIGPPTYTTIGAEAPNVYRITDEYDNENIANNLCEDMSQSQRVAVVLRPIIVNSKMDEILINIFRINDFIVVNRVFTLLTLDQAKLLAKLEGISDSNKENYISMMREGIVQIILLTKPGGVKQVQVLSNGCITGLKLQKTNYLDELFVLHEQNGVIFKEIIQKNFFNVFQSYTNLNMFSGIKEFFNLEKLIFQDQANEDDDSGGLFINQQTKEVHFEGKQQAVVNLGKHFTPIKKNQIIDDINQERFNFFLYCPKDELSTEQIVSVFMPECANIQLIHIVLKPQYIQYEKEVKQQLLKLKFKVWNIKKFLIPNAHDAKQFVDSLQVIKNANSRGIETSYNTEQFAIFSCVKPAGRKEMLSFLQDFKIEYVKGEVTEPIIANSLKSMLIPCHTDQAHDLAQHYIHPKLRIFNGQDFSNMSIEEKAICAKYMLESTFATGISVKKKKVTDAGENNKDKTQSGRVDTQQSEEQEGQQKLIDEYDIQEKLIDNPLYPQEFKHFVIKSEDLGYFEVRIHDPLSLKPYEINYIRLSQNFKLTSWYYSLINQQYMQRCPLSYQFRMMPDYKDFEIQFRNKAYNNLPSHIFDVAEYCGGFFLETIADQMKLYRKYELTEQQQSAMRRNNINRGSVVTYMWGMKLAKFVKEMEDLEFPQIDGFGAIICDLQGQFRGTFQDNDELEENLMQKYREILEKIKKQLEANKTDMKLMNRNNDSESRSQMIERIKAKIGEICKSEVFKQSRQKDMRRIFPSFVENEHIRVRVDNRQIYKRYLNQDYQTQDEFFENRDQSIDLKPDIKKLNGIIKDLLNLERLETENKFNSESLKKKLKEEETTFDMVDIEKRLQFLDDDSQITFLIDQITTKKNKVLRILKGLEILEDEEKKRLKQQQRLLNQNNKQAVEIENNEEDDENKFTVKKYLNRLDDINNFMNRLNEKYNGKNGKFNIQAARRINTFCFSYVVPEIKSKYSLVANIFYLIDVQFKSISAKYHLTNNDQEEYRQLITSLESGFKTHYKMDDQDIKYLREKYQDSKLVNRERKSHIPDFIKIEQFFIYLAQMERNLSLVEEKSNIFTRILDEKQKEIKEFKEKMATGKPDESEWRKIEQKWEPLTEKIMSDKKQIDQQIMKLLDELDKFETDFSYEESMNQEDQNQPNRKIQIKKDHLFVRPQGEQFSKYINDPTYEKFLVDILDIPYKFDPAEQNPNMKSVVKNRRLPLLEKYGDKEFLQDANKDVLQKTWLNKEPLLISHMRPVKAEDRNYLLVENIHKNQQSESEKAIQKEIRRFKISQGIPLNEDEDEQKQDEQLKKQDYVEYQKQQLKKQFQKQQILNDRYDDTNPERSSNLAQDILDNYVKMIQQEKEQMTKQRQQESEYNRNYQNYKK